MTGTIRVSVIMAPLYQQIGAKKNQPQAAPEFCSGSKRDNPQTFEQRDPSQMP